MNAKEIKEAILKEIKDDELYVDLKEYGSSEDSFELKLKDFYIRQGFLSLHVDNIRFFCCELFFSGYHNQLEVIDKYSMMNDKAIALINTKEVENIQIDINATESRE